LKPITYNPTARAEADAAAAYYDERDPQTARNFLDALAFVIAEIHCAPQRWPFEKSTRVQRLGLSRFPYRVFYRNDPQEIYILAVAHTSRRPGYWKARIAVD
jgi:toxin ParE1/3/4